MKEEEEKKANVNNKLNKRKAKKVTMLMLNSFFKHTVKRAIISSTIMIRSNRDATTAPRSCRESPVPLPEIVTTPLQLLRARYYLNDGQEVGERFEAEAIHTESSNAVM